MTQRETSPLRPISPGLLADTEELARDRGYASAADAAYALGYPIAMNHHEAHLTLRVWLRAH